MRWQFSLPVFLLVEIVPTSVVATSDLSGLAMFYCKFYNGGFLLFLSLGLHREMRKIAKKTRKKFLDRVRKIWIT
ncbi:hypothetical protein N824_10350 [Pedobacter sp. V48]|nr:hypothetical protein N824_10350 [Pedobacter sp. V48]